MRRVFWLCFRKLYSFLIHYIYYNLYFNIMDLYKNTIIEVLLILMSKMPNTKICEC